jgi:hypothetical protein
VKSVLEGLLVYWMSLETLPRSIINKIQKLIFKFLWSDHSESQHYHLCSWETLSRPKKNGGWGLRNLYLFNNALITNSLWRFLNHDSLWHQVIKGKYLKNATLTNWLRNHTHFIKAASRIWSSLVHTTPIILHWLSWHPGAGHQITIGRDRILNIGDKSILHPKTISLINQKNITVLAQASVAKDPFTQAEIWKSNSELGLSGMHAVEWERFISELNSVGVTLKSSVEDVLLWTGGDSSRELNVKNVYDALISMQTNPTVHGWHVQLWKLKLPLKVILFFWLAFQNRVLT